MSRLLVIEDDLSNRTLLGLQIEDLECEVQTADDGAVGLMKVRNAKPDAVILDLNMPNMNGFEFLSALRSYEHGKDIPVVVITAMYLDKNHCQTLRDHGVAKIFEKGRYDEDDLVDCLSTILEA